MDTVLRTLFDAFLTAAIPILTGYAALALNAARARYIEITRTSKVAGLFDAAMRQFIVRFADPTSPAFTERDVKDVVDYLKRTYGGSIQFIGATDEGLRGVVLSAFNKAMQERLSPPNVGMPFTATYVPG